MLISLRKPVTKLIANITTMIPNHIIGRSELRFPHNESNKNKAMKVLRSRLAEKERIRQEAAVAAERSQQIKSGDRSDRIRTYYFNHDYVVDHRIGMTVNRTSEVLNGELSPFVEALTLAEKTDRLKDLSSGK